MAGPDAKIPSPNIDAAQSVTAMASQHANVFPTEASKFTQLYNAWKDTWFTVDNATNSNSADSIQSQEFQDLVAMGPVIKPLVLQKLTTGTYVFAVHLYNALEIDQEMKLNTDSTLDWPTLQHHANLLIEENGNRNQQFAEYVNGWKAEQEKRCFSSNSADFAYGEDYLDLVEMGPSIIPNIMLMYAGEQSGWWYLLLQRITGARGHQVVNKRERYQAWNKWFLNGADLERVPQGSKWEV